MLTGLRSLAQMPTRFVDSYRRLALERAFRLFAWGSTDVIVRSQ